VTAQANEALVEFLIILSGKLPSAPNDGCAIARLHAHSEIARLRTTEY
jgi:hypothetical protein